MKMQGAELKRRLEVEWDKAWNERQGLVSPRFPSVAVSSVLEQVSFAVAALMSPDGLGSGGNIVLQGPKGVGKTSILNALAHVLPLALGDSRLVVRSYSLEAPEDKSDEGDTSDEEDIVRPTFPAVQDWQTSGEKRLVLLVDEVQYLYAIRSKAKKRLSFQLVTLAKQSSVLVIMTGSTASLPDLIFHHTPPTPEQRGYANFNHTVFGIVSLRPLRSKEDVLDSMRLWGGSVDVVNACFAKSGGIGRTIRSICQNPKMEFESISREMDRDRVLQRIMLLLHVRNQGNQALPWSQAGVSTQELTTLVGGDQPLKQLFQYADRGFLYWTEKLLWETLRPCILDEIRQMSQENDEFKLNLALFSVLQGFDEGSAGESLETSILSWSCGANILPAQMPLKQIKPGVAYNVDALFNKMLCVSCDHGADAFWLNHDGERLHVNLVQVKLGKKTGQITYGGPAGIWTNQDTLYSIFKRAIVALAHLRTKVFPGTELVIDQLILITSKKVKADVVEKAAKEQLWKVVEKTIIDANLARKQDEVKNGVVFNIFNSLRDLPDLNVVEQEQFYEEILPREKREMLGL